MPRLRAVTASSNTPKRYADIARLQILCCQHRASKGHIRKERAAAEKASYFYLQSQKTTGALFGSKGSSLGRTRVSLSIPRDCIAEDTQKPLEEILHLAYTRCSWTPSRSTSLIRVSRSLLTPMTSQHSTVSTYKQDFTSQITYRQEPWDPKDNPSIATSRFRGRSKITRYRRPFQEFNKEH